MDPFWSISVTQEVITSLTSITVIDSFWFLFYFFCFFFELGCNCLTMLLVYAVEQSESVICTHVRSCSVVSVVSDSLQPRGQSPTRLLCPWHSPGKNTGVGCHALLQGSFLTQGLNLSLLRLQHCRWILGH